ncbi:uncharacterized protein [Spinacia oleracea]|uniref:Endonuclease/exonuclease/phosphatase domain-containing protein n=1 Tax=Spinacia oleracea TaxID=3562 RepID=A0ABM3QQF4_SPIOL|nr:uncharacterized protein LOC130461496 [Spinacia oleracea]
MDRIISWNVRGINTQRKQNEVRAFVQSHGAGLVGLLETKVPCAKMGTLYVNMFNGWYFTTNSCKSKGGRIVLAWNPNSFTLNVQMVTSQLVHCLVCPKSGGMEFGCTFVYAFNHSKERERNCGVTYVVLAVVCLSLEDVKAAGHFYTWNNKQEGDARVFSKIDRALGNDLWFQNYPNAEADFLTEGEYDHCPIVLAVYPIDSIAKKPFRYFSMWKYADGYTDLVKTNWSKGVVGTRMYQVVQKLKRMKGVFRELNNTGFNDIHAADLKARQDLEKCQKDLHSNPSDSVLADREVEAAKKYKIMHSAYISFLKQKAKEA